MCNTRHLQVARAVDDGVREKKGPRGEYPEKGRRHGVFKFYYRPATTKQVFDFIFITYYCIV